MNRLEELRLERARLDQEIKSLEAAPFEWPDEIEWPGRGTLPKVFYDHDPTKAAYLKILKRYRLEIQAESPTSWRVVLSSSRLKGCLVAQGESALSAITDLETRIVHTIEAFEAEYRDQCLIYHPLRLK